jgi:acyl-CoA thioesterase YciA
MNDRLPENEVPAIRVVAMPANTNASGDIFGGWIMSQVDLAASIVAYQETKGRVVTVAVNSFAFKHPVFVGDLISCYAKVLKIGNTSMTIEVDVYAQRSREADNVIKVTEAVLTFVAVDENRRPRTIVKS